MEDNKLFSYYIKSNIIRADNLYDNRNIINAKEIKKFLLTHIFILLSNKFTLQVKIWTHIKKITTQNKLKNLPIWYFYHISKF